MSEAVNGLIQIIVAIIVVAIIAVIFSKKSSSASAIQSATGAFNSLLKIIVNPIQQ